MGFSAICFVWPKVCIFPKVDRGWQFYFDSCSYLLGSMCVVPTYIEARREPPLFRRCVRRPSINVLCYCVPQYEYLKPHPVVNPELVSRTWGWRLNASKGGCVKVWFLLWLWDILSSVIKIRATPLGVVVTTKKKNSYVRGVARGRRYREWAAWREEVSLTMIKD